MAFFQDKLESRHQKGKPFWILLEQEMIICTSLQTTMPVPHHSVFTGRMPFLPPNQQCQSTDGIFLYAKCTKNAVNRGMLAFNVY